MNKIIRLRKLTQEKIASINKKILNSEKSWNKIWINRKKMRIDETE